MSHPAQTATTTTHARYKPHMLAILFRHTRPPNRRSVDVVDRMICCPYVIECSSTANPRAIVGPVFI
jgi:hypothetical protein